MSLKMTKKLLLTHEKELHAVAKKASALSERSELSEEFRIVWNTFVYGSIYTELEEAIECI